MDVLAITQARLGSSRLPQKVAKTILGQSLLEIHIKRVNKSKNIEQLLIATTDSIDDDLIIDIAKLINVPFFRGSTNNVLDRFYQAASMFKPSWVVRLTADCPLIDSKIIDDIIDCAKSKNVDYCSNTLNPTFPDGMDVEVFRFSALKRAWEESKLQSEKEHVTPYINKNSSYNNGKLFSSYSFERSISLADIRLTVDEPVDFLVIKTIIEKMGLNEDWEKYAEFYLSNKDIARLNSDILRNEGYLNSLEKD
tara:strand:- start:2678 stop:3433 length:756 start_codon:yes stop_codon:yes gene_type:complete